MKNNKWNLIGRICLILSCGLFMLFSTMVYAAEYDYTYENVTSNTPYTKKNKDIRLVYNYNTYNTDLKFKNKKGETVTVSSVGSVITNGEKIYYFKGGTKKAIMCYTYKNNSTKEVLSSKVDRLLGVNGKYLYYYYYNDPGNMKGAMYRYNLGTKKSKKISTKLVEQMRSGSKRFVFYDEPGDESKADIFVMDRTGSNIKKILKANGATIRNGKVYYWCKVSGKFTVYSCNFKGENKTKVASYDDYLTMMRAYGF